MSNEEETRKKQEELQRKLATVPDTCAEIEKAAGQALQDAADARAAAKYDEVLAELMPPSHQKADRFYSDLLGVWDAFEKNTALYVQATVPFSPVTIAVWGTGANASLSASTAVVAMPMTDAQRERYERAREEFEQQFAVDREVSDVQEQMRRLQLDVTKVANAYAALQTPGAPGSDPSLLLVLRGAIDDAIAELVRRRIEQDQAGRGHRRILSLGAHCPRQGVAPEYFARLAEDYRVLHDLLSEKGKARSLPWAEVTRSFLQGVTFFRALLIAVDESKLRAVTLAVGDSQERPNGRR